LKKRNTRKEVAPANGADGFAVKDGQDYRMVFDHRIRQWLVIGTNGLVATCASRRAAQTIVEALSLRDANGYHVDLPNNNGRYRWR
jgi:hypothetical protein